MSESDVPPPHVLSVRRLSMLTSRGAPANQVENQIAAMLAAWTTELGGDRTTFRDRLNGLEEDLQAGLEQNGEASGVVGENTVDRRVIALQVALAAVRQAQARLGL